MQLAITLANHGFKDDILSTILAAKRHAYFLLASLPQFYNTFDGVTAWLNGTVLLNRKVAASRHSTVEKCVRVLESGADLIIFPEGVWNKSPNKLILDLWPGVYRIACRTGSKIVPVVHYVSDYSEKATDNIIRTVVDDPFSIDTLSEKEALDLIRDRLATWHYLMMEKYGKTSREASFLLS